MTPFKQDVLNLFSKKRGGHVEQWLYSDTLRKEFSGSQLWHEFLKVSAEYYVLQNEIDLIAKAAPSLGAVLPNTQTLIDFGVGNGQAIDNKIIPVLNGLKTVRSYVGIDLSDEFLKNAKSTLNTLYPDLTLRTLHEDFYRTSFALKGTRQLGLMLGSTITNLDMRIDDIFPRTHIVERLNHLKENMGKDNHLLISYDANADVSSIKEAYSHPYWKRFVTGIMYDVAPITEGHFSPENWKHTEVWNNEAHVLHQCAEATKDMSFSIDDKAFRVKSGERFVTMNLFKFPTPLFQSMCEEAGFEVKKHYSDQQSRMCLQLLRA